MTEHVPSNAREQLNLAEVLTAEAKQLDDQARARLGKLSFGPEWDENIRTTANLLKKRDDKLAQAKDALDLAQRYIRFSNH
jgi:hypothetical protein